MVSDYNGIFNILNYLKNLYDNLFLPPPGGPPAQITLISSMFFQNNLFLSNTPYNSNIYLSNSIEGYAPNYSKAGIFTSSINIAIVSFTRAPNNVLAFFINFPSIDY